MSSLISAVKEFFSLVGTLIEFIFGLVADLVNVVELLADTVVRLPEYFGYFFPSQFITLFVTIISLVVVYKILGREG